jgi:hypothetical protein
MFTVSRNFDVPRPGAIPKELTSLGCSPGGNNVTAWAAKISEKTDEMNSCCARAK